MSSPPQVNLTHVLGPNRTDSPLYQMTKEHGDFYAAGPPYLATARDMYKIVLAWTDFVPRVHDNYPHLLGEMFAYCLATVHVNLLPQIAVGLMVSDPLSGHEEGWFFLTNAEKSTKLTYDEIWQQQYPQDVLPFVLHYCQMYNIGPYYFWKHVLRSDFLSCQAPLLREPSRDLLKYDYGERPGGGGRINLSKMKFRLAAAWMLTALIAALNEAVEHYKQQHCKFHAVSNMNKVYDFGANIPVTG